MWSAPLKMTIDAKLHTIGRIPSGSANQILRVLIWNNGPQIVNISTPTTAVGASSMQIAPLQFAAFAIGSGDITVSSGSNLTTDIEVQFS